MFQYIQLADQLNSPISGKVKPPSGFQESDFQKSTCSGARIMRKFWETVGKKPATEAELFEILFMVLTEHSRILGWEWYPGASAVGYVFLDDKKTAAECRAFAGGLQYLAVAPKPFGLGMKLDDSGVNGIWLVNHCPEKGFLAVHPSNGVCKLQANIFPNPNAVVEPLLHNRRLYYWANHKVVLYKGFYYDPAYGVMYAAENDMESLSVTKTEVLAGLGDFKTLEQNDLRGACIIKCKSATNTYYFRRTPQSLMASELTYQGPITKSQKDWLELQLKGNLDKTPITSTQLFAS